MSEDRMGVQHIKKAELITLLTEGNPQEIAAGNKAASRAIRAGHVGVPVEFARSAGILAHRKMVRKEIGRREPGYLPPLLQGWSRKGDPHGRRPLYWLTTSVGDSCQIHRQSGGWTVRGMVYASRIEAEYAAEEQMEYRPALEGGVSAPKSL